MLYALLVDFGYSCILTFGVWLYVYEWYPIYGQSFRLGSFSLAYRRTMQSPIIIRERKATLIWLSFWLTPFYKNTFCFSLEIPLQACFHWRKQSRSCPLIAFTAWTLIHHFPPAHEGVSNMSLWMEWVIKKSKVERFRTNEQSAWSERSEWDEQMWPVLYAIVC